MQVLLSFFLMAPQENLPRSRSRVLEIKKEAKTILKEVVVAFLAKGRKELIKTKTRGKCVLFMPEWQWVKVRW